MRQNSIKKCEEHNTLIQKNSFESHKNKIEELQNQLISNQKCIKSIEQKLSNELFRFNTSSYVPHEESMESFNRIERSIAEMHNLLNTIKNGNFRKETNDTRKSPAEERRHNLPSPVDVIIYHDSLFKHINGGIMKNENLQTELVWAPKLADISQNLDHLNSSAKIVTVHTGTNDLENKSAESIVSAVADIFEKVKNRNKLFMFSCILPRKDKWQSKGNLVNALILERFENTRGFFISKNANFSDIFGNINEALYSDNIHINKTSGSSRLASNIRSKICEVLKIEYITKPKTRISPNRNNRYDRRR